MMRISATFCLIVFYYYSKSQFYSLPQEYSFSVLTQKRLAARDASIHGAVQPRIPFFSQKYSHAGDTHRVFKYIKEDPGLDVVFFKHLIDIQPRGENFTLRIDPILNLESGRDFINHPDRRLYTNTRGFVGSGHVGPNFYFETLLSENQSVFPDYIADYSKTTQVVPGQARWKVFGNNGFDYAFASGLISVQLNKNLNVQAGHGKHKLGYGYRSLLLSDNAFNYPFLRITHQWFRGRVQYTNLYASLMNLRKASKVLTANTERLFQKKSAAFQYVSVNFHKSFSLSFFQGIIWQAGDDRNRQHLDLNFFNPLIFSQLRTFGLDHQNNVLIGSEMQFKISDKISMYAQGMVDHLGYSDKTSGLGYQAGVKIFDLFGIENFFLQTEFNTCGPTAYTGVDSAGQQSYIHYNQNLAFTPAEGKELIVITGYRLKRIFAQARYNYQEHLPNGNPDNFVQLLNAQVGYVINPSYNLNVAVGVNYRNQNFSTFGRLDTRTNYIYLALKTSIYNLYYDF
jgi:hypothetical protein